MAQSTLRHAIRQLETNMGIRLLTHDAQRRHDAGRREASADDHPRNDPSQLLSYCLSGVGLACMQENYFDDEISADRLERGAGGLVCAVYRLLFLLSKPAKASGSIQTDP